MDTPVRLRPVRDEDFALLERQAVEPEFGGTFNWSGYRDLPALRRRYAQDGLIGPDDGRLVVTTGDSVAATGDDIAAGTVNWSRVTYGTPAWWCWNIGISLAPDQRGRGIGTQAQALLVTYLFDTTVAPRIEAYTDVRNVAEQRALEKAGFTREGTLRSTQFREGSWQDLHLYSVLRTAWPRVRTG